MKKIPLTQGKFAIVDDEDFERLSRHNWKVGTKKNGLYACRCSGWDSKKRRSLYEYMHHDVLGKALCLEIDHINGDGLDNRRANLRFVTRSQNNMNSVKQKRRSQKKCTSQYKGVSLSTKKKKKWRAYIVPKNSKQLFLGYFHSEEVAAKIYDIAAIKFFGEFARTNFDKKIYKEILNEIR